MIAGIVLAAGSSSRMGSPKALLEVAGRPAVEVVAARLAEAGCTEVIVVVGKHAAEIRAGADLGAVRVIEHRGWASGRTSSIQAGLAALPDDCEVIALALVDMPLVRAATIAATIAAWRSADPRPDVVVPTLDGHGGHPILLSPGLVPPIACLGPDEPLRALLRSSRRLDVPVNDRGIAIDLDTPDDLQHLSAG